MKGAVVLIQKNNVLMRTQYVSSKAVRWLDGEKNVAELLSEGYSIVTTNLLKLALGRLESLRDHVCTGYRAKNTDFIDIIKLLREY